MAAKKRKAEAVVDRMSASKKNKVHGIGLNGPSHSKRLTRAMTTDAPRKAVLHTVELLEAILLRLPAKQVFASQRVCRMFRNTVQASTKIQHKLFLRLSGSKPVTWIVSHKPDESGTKTTPPPSAELTRCKDTTALSASARTVISVAVNPLLEVRGTRPGAEVKNAWHGGCMALDLRLQRGLVHPASWKDTYITDPPCKSARLSLSWSIRAHRIVRGSAWLTVEDSNGVTLRMLTEAALKLKHVDFRLSWKHFHSGGVSLERLLTSLTHVMGREVLMDRVAVFLKGVILSGSDEKEKYVQM